MYNMHKATSLTLFIVLFTDFAVGQQLRIIPPGQTQVKSLGKSSLFTCRLNSQDTTTSTRLKWLDENRNDIQRTSGRVYVERDVNDQNMLKLYITNIIENDAGKYTCQQLEVNPSNHVETVVQEVNVILAIFKDITFDGCGSPQYPVIHRKATIQCRVSGSPTPTVYWRFKGQRLSSQTHPRYTQVNAGLEISNVTNDDEGMFTCSAEVEQEGTVDNREIDVQVHTPPKIIRRIGGSSGVEEGVAGKDVDIRCITTGKPQPKVEFYKDGNSFRLVTDGNRRKVDEASGTIHFRPLVEADKGKYKCKAINNAGEDEAEGELSVIVPPSIYDITNITVSEGQQGTIRCHASGIPTPTIKWRKWGLNKNLSNGDLGGKVRLIQSRHDILDLQISSMNNTETSNYTCYAYNKGGEVNRTGHFMVEHIPRFDPNHLKELYNWRGRTRNITCTSIADPPPVITWFHRNEQILRDNETYRLFPLYPGVSKISNLQVHVHEHHEWWVFGTYTCRAANKMGSGEIKIELHKAEVPGRPERVDIVESSPTMMTLQVFAPTYDGGMPVYGYRVEYEAKRQDYRTDELIEIENLNPSTTYVFKIRAKNDVGVGVPYDLTHTTRPYSRPFPIVIVSPFRGMYPFSYVVRWQKPRTGGLPIIEWFLNKRQVNVEPGTNIVRESVTNWVETRVLDNQQAPMLFYEYQGLDEGTYYEVMIEVRNGMGRSQPTKHVFQTSRKSPPDPAFVRRAGLSTGIIIGIVILVLFAFLIIIDISCFFMNDCGILMCLCVHLCGKQEVVREKSLEEGERERLNQPEEAVDDKEMLKQQLDDEEEKAVEDSKTTEKSEEVTETEVKVEISDESKSKEEHASV